MEELMAVKNIKMGAATLLTVHDLANYLRLSEAKIYRMAKAGEIPGCQVGNSWRFQRSLIDEWLAHKTQASYHEVRSK